MNALLSIAAGRDGAMKVRGGTSISIPRPSGSPFLGKIEQDTEVRARLKKKRRCNAQEQYRYLYLKGK